LEPVALDVGAPQDLGYLIGFVGAPGAQPGSDRRVRDVDALAGERPDTINGALDG
jgi:hypothetical protein